MKRFHISLSVYQIRDLNILLHDLIVGTLSFGHVDSLSHSEIFEKFKEFQSEVENHRNSNIHLHDHIVETLFSCYDDFPLHSEIL